MMQDKTKLTIKVISDTVCPWCFIGKRRLDLAMSHYKNQIDFEVKWLPYLLKADTPSEGVDKRTYYQKRVGSRYHDMVRNLQTVGKELNISFTEDGTIGNTINSHRLIEYAGRHGKQEEVVEALFKTYFERGNNLGSLDTLVAAAKEAGLDGDKVAAYLVTDEDRDHVLKEDRSCKEGSISGVPFFIFNDRYQFSGAQDVAVFESVFKKVLENKGNL